MDKFLSLGLSQDICDMLAKKGFESPSEIQEKVIPVLLEESIDLIGQAQTGTGKTAAFGLPIIERLKSEQMGYTKAIILTPTRELCIQVCRELESFNNNRSMKIFPIYGGQSYTKETDALRKGVDIIVGTPGRVIDHINKGRIKLDKLRYFVLDEADEMLNMGFLDDVEDILKSTNDDKTTLFFSATMPKSILNVAYKFMKDHKTISVKKKELTNSNVEQVYYEINPKDKIELLSRMIDNDQNFYGIVFCKRRIDVDTIVGKLVHRGYKADGLHGDISQNLREKILSKFKDRNINVLVATDVAARGIDVENLNHVINYDIPMTVQDYTHRIGRTGRAGKTGTASTFVLMSEVRKLREFERTTKKEIVKGEMPSVETIISNKKQAFVDQLKDKLEKGYGKNHLELAQELLNECSELELIGGLLDMILKNSLNPNKYPEIEKASRGHFSAGGGDRGGRDRFRRDRGGDRGGRGGDRGGDRGGRERKFNGPAEGQIRMFVGKGRNQGMNPRKICEIIEKETGVFGRHIDDIEMYKDYSFFNVNKDKGEQIADKFRKIAGGAKPLIDITKKKR